MRPPTASTRLAPISTPQPKEMQPHPPSEENNNGKRRIRRRSSSNNVTKPTEEAGEKTRRSKVCLNNSFYAFFPLFIFI